VKPPRVKEFKNSVTHTANLMFSPLELMFYGDTLNIGVSPQAIS